MSRIIFLTTLLSVWQNPTSVYVGPGDQTIDVVMSDGEGGAAVIWWDDVTEWNYMQVIDSAGNLKWDAEGVPIIANGSLSTQNPDVFLADDGNYWVALEGNDDIYVQKLSPSGQRLFGDEGVAVCTAEWGQSLPRLCPSGEGAIVAWKDYRPNALVYAQMISSDGENMWIDNGIQVSDTINEQPQRFGDLVSDGNSGSLIVYMTWTEIGDTGLIFIQRLDSLGNRLFPDTGRFIHKGQFDRRTRGYMAGYSIGTEDGDAIILYVDKGQYMTQKIDSSGNALWDTAGVSLGSDDYSHFGSYSPLTSHGFYVVRGEDEANEAVYIHRVALDGENPFGVAGKKVWEVWAYDPSGKVIPHVTEEGIIVWRDVWDDAPSGEGYEQRGLLAQRVDTTGNVLWSEEVLVVGTESSNPRVIGTNDKAGIVFWNQETDVYATRIDSLGNLPPGIEEDKISPIALELEVVGGPLCKGQVELRFALQPGTQANLTIFDVTGSRVRDLSVNNNSSVTWDGFDSHTMLCPAGVYFVLLNTLNTNASATAKIVLVR